jgi:hypothetical protein
MAIKVDHELTRRPNPSLTLPLKRGSDQLDAFARCFRSWHPLYVTMEDNKGMQDH